MAKMPAQKPATSEQVVCTPPEFLAAVKNRLNISKFAWDLAASEDNTVTDIGYYDEDADALKQNWKIRIEGNHTAVNWAWCNPPYSNLEPWVEKAWRESLEGAHVAMLVPASVGSNWWRDWVRNKAYITYLNNRIKFVGHKHMYPKDLALLLYAPFLDGGSCLWRWS
jgi:phage N-6-adenine-methyltransferase